MNNASSLRSGSCELWTTIHVTQNNEKATIAPVANLEKLGHPLSSENAPPRNLKNPASDISACTSNHEPFQNLLESKPVLPFLRLQFLLHCLHPPLVIPDRLLGLGQPHLTRPAINQMVEQRLHALRWNHRRHRRRRHILYPWSSIGLGRRM